MGEPSTPTQPQPLVGANPLWRFVLNRKDFDDPRLEWRRIFAEVFGTFLLVIVAAGAPTVDAVSGGAVGRVAAVVAPGLMVMAIILFMGAVSGAHLNPAVSISFALRGDFPWKRVPGYIGAQFLGATLACLVLWSMFGDAGMLGATEPGPGITQVQAMVMELILTLGLVSTILGTASKAQNVGPIAALAVGGYIALAGLWGSPISGASMNPARSFGPDVVLLDFANYWVYVVGPIAGGLLAVGVAYILRGPGGDAPAILAAEGRLGEFLPLPPKWRPSESPADTPTANSASLRALRTVGDRAALATGPPPNSVPPVANARRPGERPGVRPRLRGSGLFSTPPRRSRLYAVIRASNLPFFAPRRNSE